MSKKKSFNISKELTDGISETITTGKNNIGALRYEVIPISRIKRDPNNPRKLAVEFMDLPLGPVGTDPLFDRKNQDFEKLKTLAESIKKVGVRHAVEVYKEGSDYTLISGERRLLASIIAEKLDIPARILETKPTEIDLRLLQWIENIEREDLTAWERMINIKQLAKAYETANHETITASVLSNILGCSRQHATTFVNVLEAPPVVLDALETGTINNLEKAAFIAKQDEQQLVALLEACKKSVSLEDLKKLSATKNTQRSRKAISKGKGRPIGRINMGRTHSINVIKRIVQSILAAQEYGGYSSRFSHIDWSSYQGADRAFKELLKVMEIVEK